MKNLIYLNMVFFAIPFNMEESRQLGTDNAMCYGLLLLFMYYCFIWFVSFISWILWQAKWYSFEEQKLKFQIKHNQIRSSTLFFTVDKFLHIRISWGFHTLSFCIDNLVFSWSSVFYIIRFSGSIFWKHIYKIRKEEQQTNDDESRGKACLHDIV